MGFCDSIQAALKCKAGIYDFEGKLIAGFDIGFKQTEEVSFIEGCTYIRYSRGIIGAGRILSRDAVDLIRTFIDNEYGREAADYVQPLEYILKNDVPCESIRGKYDGYTAFYIKSSENIQDVLLDIYSEQRVEFVRDDKGVYMVGITDDAEAEANSIINGIWDEKGIDVIIGSGRTIGNGYTVKQSADHAKKTALLAERIGYRDGYFAADKMLIYNLIDSIGSEVIHSALDGGFIEFGKVIKDRELINTAEEFLKCDLNISEASRKLYIHRNTLLYRLEKIRNLTGLDIKSFDEAAIFKFLLAINRLKKI